MQTLQEILCHVFFIITNKKDKNLNKFYRSHPHVYVSLPTTLPRPPTQLTIYPPPLPPPPFFFTIERCKWRINAFKIKSCLFVPTLEEHGIFMLGVVFFSQFLAIETIVFSKKKICAALKILASWNQIWKQILPPMIIAKGIKIAKLGMLWTVLCALWKFYPWSWKRNAFKIMHRFQIMDRFQVWFQIKLLRTKFKEFN